MAVQAVWANLCGTANMMQRDIQRRQRELDVPYPACAIQQSSAAPLRWGHNLYREKQRRQHGGTGNRGENGFARLQQGAPRTFGTSGRREEMVFGSFPCRRPLPELSRRRCGTPTR